MSENEASAGRRVVIKILGKHLLNPRPDLRRSARNFAAVALWPAGTVFAEVEGRLIVEGSPGDRFYRVEVVGARAELLRRHLREVTMDDAVRAILGDAPRWALELLRGSGASARELGELVAAALGSA